MDKKNKKSIFVLIMMVLMLICTPLQVFAADDSDVNFVSIHVMLDEEGTAFITETWDIDAYDITEWYLVKENMGDMEIFDFKVTDENGKEFVDDGDWDIDRTIEEKSGRYGIVETSDGYELCWGIGSEGHHVFQASYTVTNMVKGFSDYNGFNYRFINDDLSSPPKRVEVEIEKIGSQFTLDDTGIWAFGNDGYIEVAEGKIWFDAEGLSRSSHVTIMARFEPDMFSPISMIDESFSAMEERAKNGSYYSQNGSYVKEEKTTQEKIKMALIIGGSTLGGIGVITAIAAATMSNAKYKYTPQTQKYYAGKYGYNGIYKLKNSVGNSNTIAPFDGDISESVRMIYHMGEYISNDSIMSAYLMKWLGMGLITIEEFTENGLFGRDRSFVIKMSPNFESLPEEDRILYTLFLSIADQNYCVWESEMNKNIPKINSKVNEWVPNLLDIGTEKLIYNGYFTKEKRTGFAAGKRPVEVLTDKGYEAMCGFYSFKNYLESINDDALRQGIDVEFWGDYLVFASLFGITEQIIDQISAYDPYYFNGIGVSYYNMNMIYGISHFTNCYTQSTSAWSSDGGGGSASIGGGGGFSGGGSGGGGR